MRSASFCSDRLTSNGSRLDFATGSEVIRCRTEDESLRVDQQASAHCHERGEECATVIRQQEQRRQNDHHHDGSACWVRNALMVPCLISPFTVCGVRSWRVAEEHRMDFLAAVSPVEQSRAASAPAAAACVRRDAYAPRPACSCLRSTQERRPYSARSDCAYKLVDVQRVAPADLQELTQHHGVLSIDPEDRHDEHACGSSVDAALSSPARSDAPPA